MFLHTGQIATTLFAKLFGKPKAPLMGNEAVLALSRPEKCLLELFFMETSFRSELALRFPEFGAFGSELLTTLP
jgi:hypothetical protein